MRQSILSPDVNTKRADSIVRIVLAITLALSGLFLATPAWADDAPGQQQAILSAVSDGSGEEPTTLLEQEPAAAQPVFAPLSFDPQAVYSGDCSASGSNVTWSLDTSTGVLAISGTGKMRDYSGSSAPWASYRSSISRVTISSGVVSIGNSAFYGCVSLTSVTIPSSVVSIGSSAFSGCTSLASVTIPSNVVSLGYDAFRGCISLVSVSIPSSVTSLGSSAFYGCISLASVTIPSSVTSIGSSAFSGCTSLISAIISAGVTSIGSSAFYNCTSLAP
jgi:hypothetical protein